MFYTKDNAGDKTQNQKNSMISHFSVTSAKHMFTTVQNTVETAIVDENYLTIIEYGSITVLVLTITGSFEP